MKRLYIGILLCVLALTGCSAKENDINDNTDLSGLPYYAYLAKTNPVVTITVKDVGIMELQLFPDVSKNTVDNFINYVKKGAFTNSSFHRIIKDFMVQGGIVSNTGCPIKGDFSSNGVANDLSHYRGTISMARTSVKDSATSQFFIVHKNSDFLDGEYATFGGLVSGFQILDDLAMVSTLSDDAPVKKVIIKSMTVKLNGYKAESAVCKG